MATYSPELLAALRQRYEQTDQPMNALAAEFEIGITTLQTLVRKNGWTQRSKRMRDCPPALRLLEEAQSPATGRQSSIGAETAAVTEATPTPTLPLAGGGSDAEPPDSALPNATFIPPAASSLSPLARIEALILKELEAEEAARAALGTRPRARHDAERCARTLSVLAQTIERVQRLRSQADSEAAKAQEQEQIDIDEFREEFARRIRSFIEARTAGRSLDNGSDASGNEP